MPRFICCHEMASYLEFMLQRMEKMGKDTGVTVVRLYPEVDKGKVICEVEAPSEANYRAWLERINRKRQNSVSGGWAPAAENLGDKKR